MGNHQYKNIPTSKHEKELSKWFMQDGCVTYYSLDDERLGMNTFAFRRDRRKLFEMRLVHGMLFWSDVPRDRKRAITFVGRPYEIDSLQSLKELDALEVRSSDSMFILSSNGMQWRETELEPSERCCG